jgi:hypothetical protein
MGILKKALCLFFILLIAAPCFAASKYIRAGAAGAGTGDSWADAYPAFSGFTWTRGNTYYVAGGTYTAEATITITPAGTTPLYIKKANATDNSGDAGWNASYATDQAVINSTVAGVSLSLGNNIEIDGVTGSGASGHGIKLYSSSLANSIIYFSGMSHVVLTHLEIVGEDSYSNKKAGLYWNSSVASGAHGLHIQYCYLHTIGSVGIFIGQAVGTSYEDYGFLIEDTVFGEIGLGYLGDNDWHTQGIQISYAASNDYSIIRSNVFRNVISQGSISFLAGADSNHKRSRIYNNIIYFTDLSLWPGCANLIYVHADVTSADSIFIYNNTAYNVGSLSGVTENSLCTAVDTPYALCTGLGTGSYIGKAHFNNTKVGATNIEARNNLIVNSNFSSAHIGLTVDSNNGYYNNVGANAPVATETEDPLTNGATYDFTLVSTANAVNGGADLSSVFTTDIAGITRPQGAAFDIGAYEYVGGVTAGNMVFGSGGSMVMGSGGTLTIN